MELTVVFLLAIQGRIDPSRSNHIHFREMFCFRLMNQSTRGCVTVSPVDAGPSVIIVWMSLAITLPSSTPY